MRPTVSEDDLEFTVAVLSLTGILIMVTGAPGEATRALVLARLAAVGMITLLIFQLSPARRDRWVNVTDNDGEDR